jgi:signal transduction histidine kinase
MKFWKSYTDQIRKNLGLKDVSFESSMEWRTILFYYMLIFIIPLSLIAYTPGVLFAIQEKYPSVVLVDSIAVLSLLIAGFWPSLKLWIRKWLFIVCFYFIGFTLLFLIGLSGPGFLYMLAASFFSTILFPVRYAFYPAFANLALCILLALLIPIDIMLWKDQESHNIQQLITVGSNLVFLGFFASALFPKVFDLLEKSIKNEQHLKKLLSERNDKLKGALEKVESKNSELESFAYTASHDLQEPLRMITGFLHQIEKNYQAVLDEKGRKFIFYAVDGATRMREMIAALLEYSRVGRFDGELKEIELNGLLDRILLYYSETIEQKAASFSIQTLPTIKSYESPIFQIFSNLISNALKYSHKDIKPNIKISYLDKGEFWEFSIADNGLGIAPEFQEKVFGLFQKLHSKSDYEGSGIGLSIVKKCVENLGGQIILESDVRNGSKFSFTITKNL